MAPFGFGAKVTGRGTSTKSFPVTSGNPDGVGSLAEAVRKARARGGRAQILIDSNVVVRRVETQHLIDFGDLTITGAPGSKIESNLFQFDCRTADNVILENLTFEGTPGIDQQPKDAILIDASRARGPIGFWITHCRFESYRDLSITVNAGDAADDVQPFLITVSRCYFHNNDPDAYMDIGALGIHGFKKPENKNAYATVAENVFDTVRRRSPRSSGKCVVHAYNNVLLDWGSTDGTGPQINGMESGHDGRLVAQANYFRAGALKETIHLSTDEPARPGRLTIDDDDERLKNLYFNDARPAAKEGNQLDINQEYRDRDIDPPPVKTMDETLRASIESKAGPKP